VGGRVRYEVRCPRSKQRPTIVEMPRLQLWFLMALTPLTVLAAFFMLLRSNISSSPARLLANAYSEQRTLKLRIGRTPHSPMRVRRGKETSRMERPQSLLEAEAVIARELRKHPDDSVLLTDRGQANLLEWSYEAAITDMQEALDTQPRSALVLNGLASAYFERAEAEDRFDDYGTAFELQSRALQQSPDDPIIVFNRAVTAARAYLYKQSIEDWQRYLSLDPSGDWADEAKQHLSEVQGIVEAHDKRTKAPLLTPAGFVRTVDPADSKTWDTVEPRIEEYLSVAITDWLPAAFPADGKGAASAEARKSLRALARILQNNHGDSWLKDVLSDSDLLPFSRAVGALAAAVKADNAAQNYTFGRSEAVRAVQFFSLSRNLPGQVRAEFEEVYALHFADAAPECLENIRKIAPEVSKFPYRWLQVQLQLEQSVCLGMTGNLGDASELTINAYRKAVAAGYPSLALRAAGFWSSDLGEKGQKREAWKLCKIGLQQYWASSTRPVPGYNLYVFMDQLAEENEPWFFETAIDEQALALLPTQQYPVWGAFEHSRLAKVAARANMLPVAEENLLEADRLFALSPKTEITENVRFGTTVEIAELLRKDESAQTVLDRLRSMSSRLEKISNFYVASDYFRAVGKLEGATGRFQAAEESFEKAVALMEQQRFSLRSEDDQAAWNQQSVEAYRALVDAKLSLGDSLGALAVWEMYRNGAARKPAATDISFNLSSIELQAQELREAIAQESDQLSHGNVALGGSTALVYVSIPNGIYLWSEDERGVSGRLIKTSPSYVRLLAGRLAELCATPTSSAAALQTIARRLYDLLLVPVASDLSPGQTTIIETDSTISAVPFQVLIDPAGRYLSGLHPIVYSLGLRYLRPESSLPEPLSRMDALVVASAAAGGDAGLRPLSDAIAEAHDVVRRFPQSQELIEDQASLSNIVKALPHAAIFHFAGHAGMVGGRTGLFLVSQNRQSKLTVLDSAALEGISLSSLRLAVLSACSTENGNEGRVLAPASLARSFLGAGVPHVIATRWNVDSAAGRTLVQAFYDALMSGRSVPQSLALAQGRVRQIDPHPYYWAGFDAFGNP
jgi:CHAT domain-containing protein